MKRLFLFLAIVALVSAGCATADQRIANLENKVTKLEKDVRIAMAGGAGAAFKPARALSGGTGAVDGITSPADKDVCFAVLENDATYGNTVFVYVFNANGSESSDDLPWIIQPNDSTTGDWELALASTAPAVVVSSSPFTVKPAMTRGGYIEMTVTGELDLPAAATAGFGSMFCAQARGAEVITIDPNGSEKIVLEGAAQGAGVSITSDGAAGDFSCFVAVTDTDGSGTDGWRQLGYGKTEWNTGS